MQLAPTIVARLLVAVLALAAVAGQAAHLDALSGAAMGLAEALTRSPRPAFLTLVVADAVVSVVTGLLALAVVFRGNRDRGAIELGIALAAWSYLLAYSGIIILLRPDPGIVRTLFEAHFSAVEIVGLAGLVGFTSAFPRRLGPSDLSPAEALPRWLGPGQQVRSWLLSPTGPWVAALAVALLLFGVNSASGRSLADAGLHPLMDLLRFLAVALVVLNVRRSWVLSDPSGRDRLSWILVGLALLFGIIALLIGGNILLSATGWSEPQVAWRPILLNVGLLGFLWGAGMAVFYTGEWVAADVVRRVVSLTVLTTLGLFLATGLEVLFSGALVGRVSLPPGLGTLAATLTAAATFRHSLPFIERILDQLPGMGTDEAVVG